MPYRPDENPIRVSFDQMTAVREKDGLALRAELLPPGHPETGRPRCKGCVAYQELYVGEPSCYSLEPWVLRKPFSTDHPKFCMPADRKDGRVAVWVPA